MPTAPDHSDDRTAAGDRFSRRAQSIAALLAHRLETALLLHDLSEKRLWAAHRTVARLHRQGLAPTPTRYWEETAQPEARRLLHEAMQIFEAERDELKKALQQFAITVGEQRRAEAMAVDHVTSDRYQPANGLDPAISVDLAVARNGIDVFLAAASTGGRLNEVGAWWQGRLRRRAILATAGRLLITPLERCELAVSAAEMKLLSGPPWCHDDRLLSAYEVAHSDLRDHVTRAGAGLERQARAMLEAVHSPDRRRAKPAKPRADAAAARAARIDTIDLN